VTGDSVLQAVKALAGPPEAPGVGSTSCDPRISVATLVCGFCGASVPAETRSGTPRRFCSSQHRSAAWDREHPRVPLATVPVSIQRRLGFTPPPEPVQVLGPTPEQIRDAQKPQTVRVLRMLQAGPCTTGDFLRAGIGRFGARVDELRRAGWRIATAARGDHGAMYVLIPEEVRTDAR